MTRTQALSGMAETTCSTTSAPRPSICFRTSAAKSSRAVTGEKLLPFDRRRADELGSVHPAVRDAVECRHARRERTVQLRVRLTAVVHVLHGNAGPLERLVVEVPERAVARDVRVAADRLHRVDQLLT